MSGNLCGYVVRDQQPVADAAITIVEGPGRHVDLAPLSDADGWFALDDLPAGRWRLRARGPDGASGEASVDIWDDSLSEVTIALGEASEPRPDIWREPDGGEPLPDLWREPDGGEPGLQPSERPGSGTDDDDLSNREAVELARRTSRPAGRGRKGQSRAPGSVMGRVTDAVTGQPVADALVVVTDGPGPLPDTAVTTDADGFFAIPAMEPGDWALRVDAADDGGHGELVVAVRSRRRVDVTIALVRP